MYIIPGILYQIPTYTYYIAVPSLSTYIIIILPISNQFKYYLVIQCARVGGVMMSYTGWYAFLIFFYQTADSGQTFREMILCLRTISAIYRHLLFGTHCDYIILWKKCDFFLLLFLSSYIIVYFFIMFGLSCEEWQHPTYNITM